MFSLR